jgi:hypothetical protein
MTIAAGGASWSTISRDRFITKKDAPFVADTVLTGLDARPKNEVRKFADDDTKKVTGSYDKAEK